MRSITSNLVISAPSTNPALISTVISLTPFTTDCTTSLLTSRTESILTSFVFQFHGYLIFQFRGLLVQLKKPDIVSDLARNHSLIYYLK